MSFLLANGSTPLLISTGGNVIADSPVPSSQTGGGDPNSSAEVLNRLVDQSFTVGVSITPFDTTTDFNVDDTTPYTYSAEGLPEGLSIDTSTGSITGTPTLGGQRKIVVVSRVDSSVPTVTRKTSVKFSISGGFHSDAGKRSVDYGTVFTKYVDGSKASSGDGNSLANAYKTISEATQALNGVGGTIGVKGGTYNESVPPAEGTVTTPIKLTPYSTDTVVVTSEKTITNLIRCTSASQVGGNPNYANIFEFTINESDWDAPSGYSFNAVVNRLNNLNLYEGDFYCPIATDRKTALTDRELYEAYFWTFMYSAPGNLSDTSVTHLSLGGKLQAFEDNAFVVARTSGNTMNYAKVSSYTDNVSSGTASLGTWFLGARRPYTASDKHYFHVINDPADIKPGRYSYDYSDVVGDGTGVIKVWVWPRDESNVISGFKYSTRHGAFSIREVSSNSNYFEVEGFHVTMFSGNEGHGGSAVHTVGGSAKIRNIFVRDISVSKVWQQGSDKGLGVFYADLAENIVFEHCDVTKAGGELDVFAIKGNTAGATNFTTTLDDWRSANPSYSRMSRFGLIHKCRLDEVSRNPFTGYGTEDFWVLDCVVSNMHGVHSNICTLYNSCVRPVVARSWFSDCTGYISTQHNSNLYIFGCQLGWRREGDTLVNFRVLNNDPADRSLEDGGYHHVFNNAIELHPNLPPNNDFRYDVRIGQQPPRGVYGSNPAGTGWTWAYSRNINANRQQDNATTEGRIENKDNVYLQNSYSSVDASETESSVTGVYGTGNTAKSSGFIPETAGGADYSSFSSTNDALPSVPFEISALTNTTIDLMKDLKGNVVTDWKTFIGPIDELS